ncbi:MAG: histidine kinase dimerization/phospho-acceptor domain-containing protein [Acidobacteriota bacterium]
MNIEERKPSGTLPADDVNEMILRLAHELRTPLATIKSAAQLIRRLRMSPDEALPYLESVIREVSRIDETIRSMEDSATLVAGAPQALEGGDAISQVTKVFPEE